ncbi:TonB-dependent receptor [uncultured Sunxiuqinia sp.]|uniref:TonB-dependent receptor n=1 Tax=uncultured Sunxiuqinia sp. TaxID=1573825 RepID=UPI0026292A38|nr:TonB-dependent receptor [uncultured Sunxiuqinia sp.]
MKKTIHFVFRAGNACFARKLLLFMKLTTFLLLLSVFQVLGLESYSQETTISLNYKSTSLREILTKIEDETEFYFLYSSAMIDVDTKVNVEVEKKSIPEVLNTVFKDLGIRYDIKGRQVLLFADDFQNNHNFGSQQSISIQGKITDSSGQMLPGVAVVVKGTTIGIVTDFDGVYKLSNVPADATLVFSFVGMKTQEIAVNGKAQIDVTMVEDAIGLEEVVAVGYGTSTKRKLTSAITEVETKRLEDVSFSNVGESLAGRADGVIVYKKGGEPGALPTISIRGGGEPLYVIDGIISNKEVFATLLPEDIKDLNVLKDAAATAVYGARAANGIVLVNTRRGSKGSTPIITYKGTYEISQPTVNPDRLAPHQIAEMTNEGMTRDGLEPAWTPDQIAKMKDGSDPEHFPNTDWFDLALKKSAPQQRHSLSATGGGKVANYYLSLGYLDQGSIYKTDNLNSKKYTYRSNITTTFEKIGLDVGFFLSGSINKYDGPSTGPSQIFGHVAHRLPWEHAYVVNDPSKLARVADSPIIELDKRSGYDRKETNFNHSQLRFDWTVPNVKGLTVSALGNYSRTYKHNKYWKAYPEFYDPITGEVSPSSSKPSLSTSFEKIWEWNLEGHVNYNRTFDKHSVGATLVYSMQEGAGDWFSAYRRNYESSVVDQLFAGSNDGKTNDGSAWESARKGVVGRLSYGYNNKYFIEGSFRRDASLKFEEDKRWGFFPSVSGTWVVSEEGFMQELNDKDIFNLFKIRSSYGTVGNDGDVSLFSYIPSYNLVNSIYAEGSTVYNGYREGDLVSQDLSWYTQKSFNVGFDFASLGNKLSGKFDYFYARTTGYLVSPAGRYITPLGKDLPLVKSDGAHRRAGFEAALRYKNKIGELGYEIGANITKYDQLWEKKADENEVDLKNPLVRVTHSKDYWGRAYVNDGYYQTVDEILNAPRRTSSSATKPGDIRYQDINGDGKLDGNDFVRTGSQDFPHVYYGLDFVLKYKGLMVDALFQGTGNRSLYLTPDVNPYVAGSFHGADDARWTYQLDYWTEDNKDAAFPRLASYPKHNSANNYVTSDFWLYDVQYFRLKSLTVTYDLKRELLKDLDFFSSCVLTFNGTNLLTFTKSGIKDFLDVETASAQGYAYPVQRVYSFGVRVGF